jgi:hypothetical protein
MTPRTGAAAQLGGRPGSRANRTARTGRPFAATRPLLRDRLLASAPCATKPEIRLAGHRRDPLVCWSPGTERHAGSFRGRGNRQIRWRYTGALWTRPCLRARIPELVTNSDAAITASGRARGRIVLAFGDPDPALSKNWRERLRPWRSPALVSWRHELRCSDDGEGVPR